MKTAREEECQPQREAGAKNASVPQSRAAILSMIDAAALGGKQAHDLRIFDFIANPLRVNEKTGGLIIEISGFSNLLR